MVFAVADGMGGHAAGEVASRIAVEALATLVEHPPDPHRGRGGRAARGERRHPATRRSDSPEQRGMGTTVAGLTVVDAGGREHWVVFNIGDSRVYRLADNRMSLVTRDHSEVRELMDAGLIDAERGRAAPDAQRHHPLAGLRPRAVAGRVGAAADAGRAVRRLQRRPVRRARRPRDHARRPQVRRPADRRRPAGRRGGAGRGARQRLGGGRGRRRRVPTTASDDADTAPRAGLPRA